MYALAVVVKYILNQNMKYNVTSSRLRIIDMRFLIKLILSDFTDILHCIRKKTRPLENLVYISGSEQ